MLAARRIDGDERFEERWRAPRVGAATARCSPCPSRRPPARRGLVLALFDEERRFTDDDLELARQLARAARGALERSELFEAERSSRALAQQLARTGSLLATELDPEAVLDEVVEQAPALLGADASSIRLLEGDELVVTPATARARARRRRARGVDDLARGRRRPVAAPGRGRRRLGRAAAARERPAALGRPPRYLGVPLVGPEGGVHGVLAVYASGARAWREEEIEALGALASNARAALSNAELYQRVALEKERSVAIIANIADGIVAVDRDGNVVLWNEAAARITGVPTEEALGRRPEEVLRRELAPAPDGRPVAIRRGEEEVWLSLTEAIMRDPLGVVAGRIFAFRDISAEHVVEEMKTRFVSTVSHELRTPLTSIYGFAETLLREDVALRRRGAAHVPRLHLVRVGAPDEDRRPAAERRAARDRRPAGAARADGRARGRARGGLERAGSAALERARVRARPPARSRSPPRPTATS